MTGKVKVNFTIFGGTGDLAFRKLIPALYHLFLRYRLDAKTRIIIVGRRSYTKQEYCLEARKWTQDSSRYQFKEELYKEFCDHVLYYQMDFTKQEEFSGFCEFLNAEEIQSHIFYYAVAPEFFGLISDGLSSLSHKEKVKIIIEKPFGSTLEEAKEVNKKLEECFLPENIYRIDHYLGKEMIQSIQAIRFANPIFKRAWNRDFISKVEIIAAEDLGIGSRGFYYDKTGALKDMVQNHLFQILSIVAMDRSQDDQDIYDEQIKVLKRLKKVDETEIEKVMVLGQYEGYTDEDKVDKNSTTETFAKLCLYIENERWKDVPFYVTTGKKMKTKEMEVVLTFKVEENMGYPNELRIKIQPQEGVYFKFNIKRPGSSEEIIPTEMEFCQTCINRYRLNTPEAYERLLDACIQSEQALFSKWEQIELSWRVVDHLKKLYDKKSLPLIKYPQGSNGLEFIE